MQFTIRDLLSIPLLSSAKLLSANNIISSQAIESVTVMEIPVEDFIKRNELVLTTAIGCGNNPELFLTYVKDVHSSGAAAMAIAVGGHVHYIPDEVINYCKSVNFPLIELPWEIRFSDILKIILEQLNCWEQQSINKADTLQRELLKLYLDNHPIDEVIKFLSKEFQMDVELKCKEQIENSNSLNEISELISTDQPDIIRYDNGKFLQIVPISPLLNQDPFIILFKSRKLNAKPIPTSILNCIVSILTLWIQKEMTSMISKNKEKNEYIKTLLNGSWTEKEAFINQGKKLGFEVNLPYICVVGFPEKLKEFYILHKKESIQEIEKDFKRTFAEIIENISKKLKKHIIYTFQRDLVVIFLECDFQEANHEVNCFLDLIDTFVEQNHIPSISWGIGENYTGNLTFHLGFKNARTALEIGRSHKGPGTRNTFASTGIYRLLISISNNSMSMELMHSTIGAIATYDKNNGLDLIDTLSSYIYHQGNVSQTARALSLHRQSLLYRLRKIEALTNRSLNDPDDIFLLQFCLKLWSVRFENNESYAIAE
ncbi:PucR family transcriptional regulator [Ureibacillus endophyticus]|uniref:PucR family transcriptional regulator n=1 Tax=Ureibacillus endophyticus TaxID=1978490 RepID=A0A494YTX7_9BACL|nr:PucR family transcriptional regulator [Lysinibacillus endophyticus]RKQ13602.1 PucR family transcriptional regulator [Lysinibacillus endophyticus]